MAVERDTKRIDRRFAWGGKVGGIGAAAVGVPLGSETLVAWGLGIGVPSWVYESVTDPDKKKTPLASSGTIYEKRKVSDKVKTILTLGAK